MSTVQNLLTLVKANSQLFQQVNQLYGKELAPNFNSLDFWHINENKVTQILGFFLNPKERHSHGDIYLRHFLEKFSITQFEYFDGDTIKVYREYATDQGRRIDLLIVKNNFEQVIAIENKIHEGTNDQRNQLKDYWNFLRQKAKFECCLIYLSPENKTISEHSLSKEMKEELLNQGSLLLLNYEQHLIECLNEFGNITHNNRVKSFLKDFELKLKRKYMGIENDNEMNSVIKIITDNPENIDAAMTISKAYNKAWELLKKEFTQQVKDLADEMGFSFESEGKIKLGVPEWKYHKIAISFESGGVLIGIIKNSSNPENEEAYHSEKSSLNLQQIDQSTYMISALFPAYHFLYENILTNSAFWKDIKSVDKKAKENVWKSIHNFLELTGTALKNKHSQG